ncbi:MAG: hypothetical protein AABZ31_13460 [Bdellovibrionota bacterium]
MPTTHVSVIRLIFFFVAFVVGVSSRAQISYGVSIRASDVTSIRTSVNVKRASCGLGAQTWTDDPLLAGTPISNIHLNELRSAVSAVYLSQLLPAPTFTDSTILAGSVIKAIHFQELNTFITTVACAPTINGLCGAANLGTYANAAAANATGLCLAGTAAPAALIDPGPWSWACNGSGPGYTSAACSATQSVVCPAGTSATGLGAIAAPGCRCPSLWMNHWDGTACYGVCPSGCYPAGYSGAGFATGPVTLTWQTTKYPNFSAADSGFNCGAASHNCMSCYHAPLTAVVWIRGIRGGPSYFCP